MILNEVTTKISYLCRFEALKHGEMFICIEPMRAYQIYMKMADVEFDIPGKETYVFNGVNLKTGIPVHFDRENKVCKVTQAEITAVQDKS